MNVLLVSECEKNALKETRRILDQFAERCGTRTWRTHITQVGLETLRKLLKSTARKNTAVACHWLRSRNHSELIWIVGDLTRFNHEGIVPTNSTSTNVLRKTSENDWHTLTEIKSLAEIAALFHDFGKANDAFQEKINPNKKIDVTDKYRHEWLSLRLFEAFVENCADDKEWIERLFNHEFDSGALILQVKHKFESGNHYPFKNLKTSLTKAIGWLILTHHFLPHNNKKENIDIKPDFLEQQLDCSWDRYKQSANRDKECYQFSQGLPFDSQTWAERAHRWANDALTSRTLLSDKNWLDEIYTLHLARLSLMLADHYYSNQGANLLKSDNRLNIYANTKDGKYNQKLDDHLIGVADAARQLVRQLPRLESALPTLSAHYASHFKRRAKEQLFRWQDKSYELALQLQINANDQGFFGVNMASTGRGKTLTNAKIMYALSKPDAVRFTIALGLRTLTLQTGQAYKDLLRLQDEDIATIIGSHEIKQLFEESKAWANKAGSESAEPYDELDVHYNNDENPNHTPTLIEQWFANRRDTNAKKLLNAPIVVCTIDHLIGATEGISGGHQILPMLRLLTSDLIIDEPDDFDIDDLHALTRLVHWSGMLGGKILLSSATLPPALIEGLFVAYLQGREQYQKARGIPNRTIHICCAWFDEFYADWGNYTVAADYRKHHDQFIKKRQIKLNAQESRNQATIESMLIQKAEIPGLLYKQFAQKLYELLLKQHTENHVIDLVTQQKVSFGVIRMANIDPLVAVTKKLLMINAPDDTQIFYCTYHSHFPLIVRSEIETTLDMFLNRKDPQAVFALDNYKRMIKHKDVTNIIFVVLATPVAEVGRDHDYDWAIIEPSSMRSIIQLAGRVRRHRDGTYNKINIQLLDANIKALKQKDICYTEPGFEKKGKFELRPHQLSKLLLPEQYQTINANPRIAETNPTLAPSNNLVALEHARLQATMLNTYSGENGEFSVTHWWENPCIHLLGQLQVIYKFRSSEPTIRYALLFNNEEEQFCELPDKGEKVEGEKVERDSILTRDNGLQVGARIQTWPALDYTALLARRLPPDFDEDDLNKIASRFGYVDLPKRENCLSWCYNPVLGFYQEK